MESFRITLAQVAPAVMDVEKNMKRALSLLDDCAKRGSSILVLPELYLSGYEVKEAISTEAGAKRLKGDVDAALPLIAEKTRESGCDILISYPLFEHNGKRLNYRADGEKCFSNWKKLTQGTAFSQTSYVVCCNQAASGCSIYFGGSHVVDPNGDIVAQLPLFEEAVVDVEIDINYLPKIREMRPLLHNERLDVYKKYI